MTGPPSVHFRSPFQLLPHRPKLVSPKTCFSTVRPGQQKLSQGAETSRGSIAADDEGNQLMWVSGVPPLTLGLAEPLPRLAIKQGIQQPCGRQRQAGWPGRDRSGDTGQLPNQGAQTPEEPTPRPPRPPSLASSSSCESSSSPEIGRDFLEPGWCLSQPPISHAEHM